MPYGDYDSRAYRGYVLAVLTAVYALNFIDRQLLVILQEPIKLELGLSDTQLGLLSGLAFAVFYVICGIPIARLAESRSRRNVIAFSIVAWSVMTAVCGLAQNYTQLLLARMGVGVGESGGSPPSHSMISDMYPPGQRSTALSIFSTGVNIGILGGFLLGAWLNEFFGWRSVFLLVGLPGVLFALLVGFTVAEPVRGRSDPHRPRGGSTHRRAGGAAAVEQAHVSLRGARLRHAVVRDVRDGQLVSVLSDTDPRHERRGGRYLAGVAGRRCRGAGCACRWLPDGLSRSARPALVSVGADDRGYRGGAFCIGSPFSSTAGTPHWR